MDGDTFRIGGRSVRIHGIDAPEQDQTCQSADGQRWRCGAWVSEMARARYDGQNARCDVMDIDRYDRIVARCESRGGDMGQWLVSEGLAFAFRKYSMDYDLAEKQAAVGDRGLHGSLVQSPAQFRAARLRRAEPQSAGCTIKGNISRKGVRIYHLEGQRDYARTGINTRKGERWFCSEREARAAGWRKARR